MKKWRSNLRKYRKNCLLTLLSVVILLMFYTVWDNNRVKIVEQKVLLDDLPADLEEYTIVQISDLHEKEFGTNQKRLIEAINSISYDAIIFTGDMLDGVESGNYRPFYSLIENISNKQHAWFIPGNTDPNIYSDDSFDRSNFIQGMEERGVELLESIDTVRIGNSVIHFVDFEISFLNKPGKTEGIVEKEAPANISDEQYRIYQEQLIEDIHQTLDKASYDNSILVALNHYPVVDTRIDSLKNDSRYTFRDYDLIISGHYHGGQIRLPFVGALFVPEGWYRYGGIFPPRNRVKGIWEYNGIKQYVSTGLGSSDAIPFLKFRFLNSPEINVLTLTSKR